MGSPKDTARDQDTFARSCAHWSEAGRMGMDSFYVLASEDYRQLATAVDWRDWLAVREAASAARGVRLLDVACGSGKFPTALRTHGGVVGAGLQPIVYDLLDPSAFSLREARGALQDPFTPGREFRCRLQDLHGADRAYDVVWATHALYAVPPDELGPGLARFVNALADGGAGFIANACEASHYLDFYRAYIASRRAGQGTPYTSAEAIVHALERLGIAFETRCVDYEARAPFEQERAVEGYLQRCVFDDTLSLDDMLSDRILGAYLADCRNGEGWRFRQRVLLIFFTRDAVGPVTGLTSGA